MQLRPPRPGHTTIAVPESHPLADIPNLIGLTDADVGALSAGIATQLYRSFGAHPLAVGGVEGTCFAVWAPNAERVSVIGDFNRWEAERHPLCRRGHSGVWEGFVPDIGHGARYKYQIASHYDGYQVEKADPFAFFSEQPPRTAGFPRGHPAPVPRLDERGHGGATQREVRSGRRGAAGAKFCDHGHADVACGGRSG